MAFVWSPNPFNWKRKGLGKNLARTGVLSSVLLKERMPHWPTNMSFTGALVNAMPH